MALIIPISVLLFAVGAQAACKTYTDYLALADVNYYVAADALNTVPYSNPSAPCNDRTLCLGFNSDGYTLKKTAPTVAAAGKCVYLKTGPLLDSATCGIMLEAYNIIPDGSSWGTAPSEIRTLWTSSLCNTRSCAYLNEKYGVTTAANIDRLPAELQDSFERLGCAALIKQCPKVAGYTVTPNVDIAGMNLTNAGSTKAAASLCMVNGNCLAFNQLGEMKTDNLPLTVKAGACVYRKRNDVPPPPPPKMISASEIPAVDGYIALPNFDIVGDNLQIDGEVTSPAANCSSRPDCLAFNPDDVLKTKLTLVPAIGRWVYIKNTTLIDAATCGHISAIYNIIPGASAATTNWGNLTIQTVKDLWVNASCSRKMCGFYQYTYNTDSSTSWGTLPTTLRTAWTSIGCDTIMQNFPRLDGHMVNPGFDCTGGNLLLNENVTGAATDCIELPYCRGFSTVGWLKSAVFPLISTTATDGLYVKMPGDGETPATADPCTSGSHSCDPETSTCVPTPEGSYKCECNGFSVSAGDNVCVATNDVCKMLPCGPAPNTCTRDGANPAGYNCTCTGGFISTVIDGAPRCYGNLAVGKPTFSTTGYVGGYLPSYACDSSLTTYFLSGLRASATSIRPAFYLDLGGLFFISGFRLYLETSYLSRHYGIKCFITNSTTGTTGITSTLFWEQNLVDFGVNPGAYKGFLGLQDGTLRITGGGLIGRRIYFENWHFNWQMDRLAFTDVRIMGYAASRTEYLCLTNPCGLGTCSVTFTGYTCTCNAGATKLFAGTLAETCKTATTACPAGGCPTVLAGGFCPAGYRRFFFFNLCFDINECLTPLGIAYCARQSKVCSNTRGSFTCVDPPSGGLRLGFGFGFGLFGGLRLGFGLGLGLRGRVAVSSCFSARFSGVRLTVGGTVSSGACGNFVSNLCSSVSSTFGVPPARVAVTSLTVNTVTRPWLPLLGGLFGRRSALQDQMGEAVAVDNVPGLDISGLRAMGLTELYQLGESKYISEEELAELEEQRVSFFRQLTGDELILVEGEDPVTAWLNNMSEEDHDSLRRILQASGGDNVTADFTVVTVAKVPFPPPPPRRPTNPPGVQDPPMAPASPPFPPDEPVARPVSLADLAAATNSSVAQVPNPPPAPRVPVVPPPPAKSPPFPPTRPLAPDTPVFSPPRPPTPPSPPPSPFPPAPPSPPCTIISGYWAAMDSDVQDNTIASMLNAAEAEIRCNADPNCLGFNSRGQLKSRTMPLAFSRRSCFYTKLSTVCESLRGTPFEGAYYTLPDFNSNGATLNPPALSLLASVQSCSSNTACRGANSLRQTKAVGNLTYSRGTCYYAKRQVSGTACGALPSGYTVAIDYDTAGGNMTTPSFLSVQAAATACDADTACRGFSRQQDGFVTRKSSSSPLTPASRSCFFLKIDNTGCPAYDGYRAEQNANHEGDTISIEASTVEAYTKCEQDATCEGFNSKGAVKRLARPLTISRGTCFYRKIAVGCSPQNGYTVLPDATVTGKDIASFTITSVDSPLADVRRACDRDPACKGFSSSLSAKTAATKSDVSPLVYSRKACFYVKAPR